MSPENAFAVLVVEDGDRIAATVAAFRSAAFDVRSCATHGEALVLAGRMQPDLILCDIAMSAPEGYALAEALMGMHATRHIPIIFLTEEIDAASELRAFSLGAVDFLPKDLDPQVLEIRIETRIALRRSRQALKEQKDMLETLVAERTADLEASQRALREAMHNLRTTKISTGVYWVQVPEADLYVLCASPADIVKQMMMRGYIAEEVKNGVPCETGPNVILLSDKMMQNGGFSNLSEFPILQMLYRQGMLLPGHPNNTGRKPILVGTARQVKAQLDYIHRGNYGLTSIEELMAAGLTRGVAEQHMALKLGFAFGKIRSTEELIDTRIVEWEPVEIENGVWIQRIGHNHFEFRYRDATTRVNLNLQDDEEYESPYAPGHQLVERQFFGVIHCGEGDGWDVRRQSMGSIVMFQGRFYLVDAGPSILDSLHKLGIDLSEIDGIFHTHAHDDHFAGLPSLILSGNRLKYYATPLVRHSVVKKLTALMSIGEDMFEKTFEVVDLKEGAWNDVGGLEVMPMHSPHPVENSIFMFRAMDDDGYKTYAHWADIVSFDVLDRLLAQEPACSVLPADFRDGVRARYLTPASVKKIDGGGGLIHGQPMDFADDVSDKIILAHRSGAFAPDELEIGSQASFGAADVLIATDQDYLRRRAHRFLSEMVPVLSQDTLDTLMRADIETFNAGSIILKRGSSSHKVYLLLTGTVEYHHPELSTPITLATGSVINAQALFTDAPLAESWRATSDVRLMRFGAKNLQALLHTMRGAAFVERHLQDIGFLQRTWLFGNHLSTVKHSELVLNSRPVELPAGARLPSTGSEKLHVVRRGSLNLTSQEGKFLEKLRPGDFFGEEFFLGRAVRNWQLEALEPVELIALDSWVIENTPIVLWKLHEYDQRRQRLAASPKAL